MIFTARLVNKVQWNVYVGLTAFSILRLAKSKLSGNFILSSIGKGTNIPCMGRLFFCKCYFILYISVILNLSLRITIWQWKTTMVYKQWWSRWQTDNMLVVVPSKPTWPCSPVRREHIETITALASHVFVVPITSIATVYEASSTCFVLSP